MPISASWSHSISKIPNLIQTHYSIQALVIHIILFFPITFHFVPYFGCSHILVFQRQAFTLLPLQNGNYWQQSTVPILKNLHNIFLIVWVHHFCLNTTFRNLILVSCCLYSCNDYHSTFLYWKKFLNKIITIWIKWKFIAATFIRLALK